MLEVTCIKNEEEFFALRGLWDELWTHAGSPSFFLSHSWFRCCWPELRDQLQLRILLVRDGDQAIAIAPLVKSRVFTNGLPVERLSFMEHPEAQIADVLLRDSGSSADALRVMLGYLFREGSSDWQLLSLDKIPPESKSLNMMTRLCQHSGFRYSVQASHRAPFIPLRGGWEGYVQSRTPRFRKTLRNVANRVRRLGDIVLQNYSVNGREREAFDKLFRVSGASWKASNGIAITSSEGRKRFFEELSRQTETGGTLEVWILEANGIPIASETQIKDGKKIYALRSDYDERYAESSPGTYLQAEILRNLFEGSYEEYNFGVGRNPYKMRWTDQETTLMNLKLFNRTLYGRFLHSIHSYRFLRRQGYAKTPGGF